MSPFLEGIARRAQKTATQRRDHRRTRGINTNSSSTTDSGSKGNRTRSRSSQGFTLVEILASLLFLAIAVPAIVAALGVASRTSEVAERGSLAGNLAENKLNEMLVDNAWQSAAQSNGDFGADFPFYHWRMSTQTWAGATNPGTGTTSTTNTTTGTSSLTELSIEVLYPVQGSEHSVRLTTLVNSSPTTSGATTTTGASSTSPTK